MDMKITVTGAIILTIIIGLFSFNYVVDKDYTTLTRDGSVMFKERWYVEAERTYFNMDSWYDINVKCPKILLQGGHTTATRCYYPDNYYESMSRSLINTQINHINTSTSTTIIKEVPYYAYGTRGSYAGKLREYSYFEQPIEHMEDIPLHYYTEWAPKDTRNYKLRWHITNVKDIDIPDGNYTMCNYYFGDVKIDINDCDKMDRVEIEGNTIDVYFKAERGFQNISAKVYDPIKVELIKEIIKVVPILDSYDVYLKDNTVCVTRTLINPSTDTLFVESKLVLPAEKTLVTSCVVREYVLDDFIVDTKMDVFGIEDAAVVKEVIKGFTFNTNDEEWMIK